MGWPVAECRAATSSQLEACGCSLNARRSWPPTELSTLALELPLPETGGATGVNWTEPGSGSASPGLENGEAVSYGYDDPVTVVGASGSFLERKSDQACAPGPFPSFFCSAWSTSAERSSLPPPLPKMPPMSEASA